MRLVPLALLAGLTGCPVQGSECDSDPECGGALVCARDHECVDASTVRAVRVTWTINGGPANTITCEDHDLYIEFASPTDPADDLGFRPVPCFAGQFSVDKLPRRFTEVELGFDNDFDRDFATFDANGDAMLDLEIL
jgi:hypothetical protein